MIRLRYFLALLAFAGTACETFTDPPLPAGATVLIPPPVYARWWAMTEACSGFQRDMSTVTWYVATDSAVISAGSEHDLSGYYSPLSNRIVLADTANLLGGAIRHEMLHALLGAAGDHHPRAQFLGRCGGTVDCNGSCVADAGPPPPPDPTAVTVAPSALEVTGVVEPATPSRSIDDGWFTFTIMVTNPRATPVIVALAPSGNGLPPISVAWDIKFLTVATSPGNFPDAVFSGHASDIASATRFAAGETKRIVADYRVGDHGLATMLPGTYVFTGYYNGHSGPPASVPDTVTLVP